MPPFSRVLTKKQQWRRMGHRKTAPPSPWMALRKKAPQREGADPHDAGEEPLIEDHGDYEFDGHPVFWRGRSRPLQVTGRSNSWTCPGLHPEPHPGPTRTKLGGVSAHALGTARERSRPVSLKRTASFPLYSTEATKKVSEQTPSVHFNRCVRMVLVPSRRDLDAATLHRVWWSPEEVEQLRCAADQFFKEHGKLSGPSEEELQEERSPPGMPALPVEIVDNADVTSGAGCKVAREDSVERLRRRYRRIPGTVDRDAERSDGVCSRAGASCEGCEGGACGRSWADDSSEKSKSGRNIVVCPKNSGKVDNIGLLDGVCSKAGTSCEICEGRACGQSWTEYGSE